MRLHRGVQAGRRPAPRGCDLSDAANSTADGVLRHARPADRGHTRVEPTPEAERDWLAHVHDTGRRMLFTQVDSWMMGINSNVAGKDKRTFIVYPGGAPKYLGFVFQ